MSGDHYLKQLAHAYAAYAKSYAPCQFIGQNHIPHNPKNNHRTKSKRKKK